MLASKILIHQQVTTDNLSDFNWNPIMHFVTHFVVVAFCHNIISLDCGYTVSRIMDLVKKKIKNYS